MSNIFSIRRAVIAFACATGLVGGGFAGATPVRAAVSPWGTVLVSGAAWAGPYSGLGDLNVYSNGDGTQDRWSTYGLSFECVELATRWASVRWGVPPFSWHVNYAYQMWAAAPPLFAHFPNGGASAPQFGDIMIFDQTSFSVSGHDAVVSGTGPGYVDIVEQNWNNAAPTGKARLPISGTTMAARWGLPIVGWLRPSSVAFVTQAYRDLLGREPDAGGLAAWTGLLDRGASRFQAAQALAASGEYRYLAVSNLYRTYLQRTPDQNGQSAYASDLGRGLSDEWVGAALIGSPEYLATRGNRSDSGFLDALYTDVLHRPVDQGGEAWWLRAISRGTSRASVAGTVLASGESQSDIAQQIYLRVLRRSADSGGLAWSVGMLSHGVRDEQLTATLMASDEYANYAYGH